MEILSDFQTSVRKALEEIEPEYEKLPGLVICGTHSPSHDESERQIKAVSIAREQNHPFLGICHGHQIAAVEHARHVIGIPRATSPEWSQDRGDAYVIRRLEKLHVGLGEDGESYWHQYFVDPDFEKMWKKPDNFFTCQFHPEYNSSKDKPHPLLVAFIEACKRFAESRQA